MSRERKFYITTPIYYPSDRLHIGHSYTTVAADVIARYKRMQGYDVCFLTGTDEHGQKIETIAGQKGQQPKEYVDKIVASILELWKLLNISYDRFIRTTDQNHMKSVQQIFKTLYEKGDIYKGRYRGMYCGPCESFWTGSQLREGKCPDCGREVLEAEEEAYFFRLSKYQDRLLEHYKANPEFVEPQSRLNEMINNFVKPGLEDLCVSRSSFKWGIPVDFDKNHIVYVWIDALSNYISALGYPSDTDKGFNRYWPADIQLVGKEIIRFHVIIWPALLMALNLPLPKKIYGHGWLLLGGEKMSKSKGNVVDPVILCNRYGVDAVRYFLLREIPFGSDGSFTNQALINRINSDLANDLGNLVSRTVAMADKYFGGEIPDKGEGTDADADLIQQASSLSGRVEYHLDKLQYSNALSEIWKVIGRANKYIDETMPWILCKDQASLGRLTAVLYNLLETIRIITVTLTPFVPETAGKIAFQIGADSKLVSWQSAGSFGLFDRIKVNKASPLFPRIDLEKEMEELEKINRTASAGRPEQTEAENTLPLISIDDFSKLELKVVKVKECTNIPKSDNLLRFILDDGQGDRQVVSGIAKWYKPQELVGKTLICVTNLKPVKLRGVESCGMLLSAETSDGGLKVVELDSSLPAGSLIK